MRYVNQEINPEAALTDLQDPDPRVRVRAADALAVVEGEVAERACAALRDRLADDDPDVRYTVALALGELRDADAVDALIEATEGDGHPLPRQAAVIALGRIGDPRATAALGRMLRDAPPDVRFQAATSLVQVNPQRATGYLRKALRDGDAEVRASAAAALGDLGDPAECDRLVRLLEDPVGTVQLEAAVSLARLGDRRGTPVLVLALDHDDSRYLAAEQLFRCPDPASLPTLEKLLGGWFTPALLKVWLAAALVRQGAAQGRPALLKALDSRKSMVKGLAIELLGELDEPWADDALKELAESPGGEKWREEIQDALDRTIGSTSSSK